MGGIRILTLIDHYYPGWKAGGPVRAIQHLVAHLGDSFAFDIVTSDRDLGDTQAYSGIPAGSWQQCGNARVLHLAPAGGSMAGWKRLLGAAGRYDLVYLNSLFSRSTIRILTLRRLGLLPGVPYLIAPRGELQLGALALKPARKAVWLTASRALRLYDGVQWQAATSLEQKDILRALRMKDGRVHVAPDVPLNCRRPAQRALPGHASEMARVKRPGRARVIFISRICRMKNLDYALRVLSVVSGEVDFDIYGPIEDEPYWRECVALMHRVPSRVTANYRGALLPDDVPGIFAGYDLFLLPTRGESFGHVILESLLAGCPALISDRTPWRHLEADEAGWDLPLAQPRQFAAAISRLVAMDEPTLQSWSAGARRFVMRQARLPEAVDANRRLFLAAARQSVATARHQENCADVAAPPLSDMR